MVQEIEILEEIRSSVRALCGKFPGQYWRELDTEKAYPSAFVKAMTEAGFLGVLIPEVYGGSGMGVEAASVILEEIHKCGCNAAACHAQMYTMGTILRHGRKSQKSQYLPEIASGKLRLQAFGVTEPSSGTDATRIQTTAVKKADNYIINGQKVWTSRVEHSDLMLLIDIREAQGNGLTIRPIPTMINHATTEVFFDDLAIPASSLVGKEGEGFKYILDGMNAERILIGSECIGDAYWFIEKATSYARDRKVFGKAIGENQGIQFPIARAFAATEAAKLMVEKASHLFDAGKVCGTEANMAKMLAADASWEAADMCLQTHGGYGFAEEYDIERKFRETRLYQIAPISTNLILSYIAEHELKLPRSY